jgi:hypothetical protein
MKIVLGEGLNTVEWDNSVSITPELIMNIDRIMDEFDINLENSLVEKIVEKITKHYEIGDLINRCYDEDKELLAEIAMLLELMPEKSSDELFKINEIIDKRMIASLILPLIIYHLNYVTLEG